MVVHHFHQNTQLRLCLRTKSMGIHVPLLRMINRLLLIYESSMIMEITDPMI